jgi:hypothetical protein
MMSRVLGQRRVEVRRQYQSHFFYVLLSLILLLYAAKLLFSVIFYSVTSKRGNVKALRLQLLNKLHAWSILVSDKTRTLRADKPK